jgi:ribosomal protein S27E
MLVRVRCPLCEGKRPEPLAVRCSRCEGRQMIWVEKHYRGTQVLNNSEGELCHNVFTG